MNALPPIGRLSPASPPPPRNRRTSAFTLLEVVLAITILASPSATVYQVVTGSTQCAALLEENQRQNDRTRTLFETLRTTFQTLPGGGSITVEIIEDEPLIQEITVTGVPGAFPIGTNPASRGDTTVSIREQPPDRENPDRGILYTLAITREDFAPPSDEFYGLGLRVESDAPASTSNSGFSSGGIPDDDFTPDDEGRYWFPLIKNIRAIEWGIYDPEEEDFVTEWTSEQGRPKMLELNLLLEGWETPIRGVFTVADVPTSTKPTTPTQEGIPAGTTLGQPGQAQPGAPPAAGGPPQGGGRPPQGGQPQAGGRPPQGGSPQGGGRPPQGGSPQGGGRPPQGGNPQGGGQPAPPGGGNSQPSTR